MWSTEPARLEIVIHPPVWKTVWAYAAYVAGTVLLLLLARRNTINRERLKAQVAIEQAEKDALKDLDKLKTKFFSNITHEFRTPLTLIQGPATELFEKVKDPESRRLLRMISSNSNRLLKLINQMLDLARLDAGEMKAALRDTNLSDFFTARISQFTSLAASRGIDFAWKLSDTLPSAFVDDEKLEAITINLISNALKFTPEGGRVTVSVQWLNGALQLDVEDTGRGIPADKLNRIYDRFYQVEPNDSSHSEGTGIGLALVKQYTEIMHGRVQVESTSGVGTRFTVTIPAATGTATKIPVSAAQLQVTEESQSVESDLPLLLLVDDSEEIRTFIKVCLGQHFRYEEARHGREGLERAIEHLPDLIISDLMMPEMDGLELCTRLRKDKRTDHIPFVMLTAKAAENYKLEGLQTGAVDYLVKPFNKAELLVKVQNLIALRTKLQAHIRTSILAQATHVRAESAEEQFVLKARRFVEEHIKDENLSVETLAREVNLSREQCYRKLTAITGMSPSAFIRKIKLQRASQLLASKWGTVS